MLNFLNDCVCDDPTISRNRKVNANGTNNNNNNTSINNNINHTTLPSSIEQNASCDIKSTSGRYTFYDRKRFNRISSKCPEFIQNYCMCFFRKIEPIECNGKTGLQNGTPIIPITLDSDVYVLF